MPEHPPSTRLTEQSDGADTVSFESVLAFGLPSLCFDRDEPAVFREGRTDKGCLVLGASSVRESEGYSMTRLIRHEHFAGCTDWWGGAKRTGRKEGERAWKVSVETIKERGYNLDIKNPHTDVEDYGDPETLLAELTKAEAKVTALQDQLKNVLAEALLR